MNRVSLGLALTKLRYVILAVVAIILGVEFGLRMPLTDFIEYWSAGRLAVLGQDPYSAELMFRIQSALRPEQQEAIMMWNPPWTLPLVAPFALLDFKLAGMVWTSLHVAISLACGHWLWRRFGGGEWGAWLVAILALLFPPTILGIGMGQISPLMLLGLCGFLHYEKRGSGALAGGFAALTLIKPHFLYLFWLALAARSVSSRRWGPVAGALTATLSLTFLALLIQPDVLAQYWGALQTHPPDYFMAPSAGVLTRMIVGWERSWPQVIPLALGCVWLFGYWRTRPSDWDWSRNLSPVLFASVITGLYGWVFDQVVLLIPIIYLIGLAVRSRSVAAIAGTTITFATFPVIWWLWQHPLYVAPTEPGARVLRAALDQPNAFWHIAIAPLFALAFAVATAGSPYSGTSASPEDRSGRQTPT